MSLSMVGAATDISTAAIKHKLYCIYIYKYQPSIHKNVCIHTLIYFTFICCWQVAFTHVLYTQKQKMKVAK